MPGLLQTADYIDAVVRAWTPEELDESIVEERRRVRQQRQARLDDSRTPLKLHALIHEGALHIPVGGEKVMAAQIDHLMERAQQKNVTVQVIPNGAGAYAGMGTAYTLLTFDGNESAAVYLENLGTGLYIEDSPETPLYAANFASLRKVALAPKPSMEFLSRIRREGRTS